jgi:hypothetical protein
MRKDICVFTLSPLGKGPGEESATLLSLLTQPFPDAEETSRLLYHRAGVAAKLDSTDSVYLYQYLVFCAHGLFG